ncbi:MAG TPA: serine hydrolase [Chitinophagaceae bacterium]|nr:serine hydrolase [Chitinophagaceae bacterium]
MVKLNFLCAWLLIFILPGAFAPAQHNNDLVRSIPEAEGVSSSRILNFVEAIANSGQEWHSFMLLRHGKVVAEGWWDPYGPQLRHSMYSVSKSFTSTAIGFAVSEKKLSLSDKVISFFPGDLPDTVSPYLAQLTVKDLLIMSTGHDPEPTGEAIRSSRSWVASFLKIPLAYEPGTKFLYNTLATYMLSAVIQKVTGEKLMDYLKPRLFSPLGINEIDWEVSPQGINTGGYGLRLKTEDMARFGQLYLQNGKWNGKQLLSPQWINEATTTKIDPMPIWVTPGTTKDSSDWRQGYGYQFWRCRNNAYRADGLAGQFIIVMPDHDAVLAITAEVYETQKELNLVWKYLLPAFHKEPLPADEKSNSLLKRKIASLAVPLSPNANYAANTKKISGRVFELEPNDKRLKNISFRFRGDSCLVSLKTDSSMFPLVFGNGKWLEGKTMKTGPYMVATLVGLLPFKVAGSFSWQNANTLELVLRYIETPHTERMICRFGENGISVEVISSKSNSKKTELRGRMLAAEQAGSNHP